MRCFATYVRTRFMLLDLGAYGDFYTTRCRSRLLRTPRARRMLSTGCYDDSIKSHPDPQARLFSNMESRRVAITLLPDKGVLPVQSSIGHRSLADGLARVLCSLRVQCPSSLHVCATYAKLGREGLTWSVLILHLFHGGRWGYVDFFPDRISRDL